MPRAKNLKEAYNNFYVEPLKENQEFEEFYVQWPGHISPMQDLKDRIELAERKEKYLFLGFRGSGKSTELYRLEAALDRSRFIVVNYSIRDDLNLSDFDFRDFFVSMALKVYDIARVEGIVLNPDIEKDFQDFARRKINKCKEARDEGPDSVLTRELLFSLTAVEYEDEEGRWCEINPMLRPLVEKWSQFP